MAFRYNKFSQITLNDSFNNLSPRTQKTIKNSWAQLFHDIIMPAINEEPFKVLYSDVESSRPITPVNLIIGALILKSLMNLTDDELLDSIICDPRYQYALGTTSYEEQPFSDRTLSRFRERLYKHANETGEDLIEGTNKDLAEAFIEYFKMTKTKVRMDSLMIAANCRKLSRLELFYKAVAKTMKSMYKNNESIKEEMKHYLNKEDFNQVIYHENRDSQTDERLEKIFKDSKKIIKEYGEKYSEDEGIKLLKRLLDEQCHKDEEGNYVELKKGNEISPESMQTPTDPEATYRNKAGKGNIGYVANVVETYDDGKSFITGYDLQQNIYSDSQFFKDEMEKMGYQEEKMTVVTDGAYGGEENIKLAKEKNVTLVTTTLLGKDTDEIFGSFEIHKEKDEVEITCPQGYKSQKVTINKNNQMRVIYDRRNCETCPFKDRCNVKLQKKTAVVSLSETKINRGKQKQYMDNNEEYIKLCHERNGVEAIPSNLRRRYQVDKRVGSKSNR